MAKRGRLSNLEKLYIEEHYDGDVSDIADHLDRSQEQISKFIEEVNAELEPSPTNPERKVKPKHPVQKQGVVTDSRTKKTVGAVSTGDISERGDVFSEQLPEMINKYGKDHSAIHRPRG